MKKLFLKKLIAIVTAVTAILGLPLGTNAEWRKDSNGWWNTEGNSWSIGWKQIDNKWYYFDSKGYMKTGWINDDGTWYYADNSGSMKTGWINDGGTWYYTDNSGSMKTGWINDGDKWYFTSSSGDMQTGIVQVDNEVYYLNDSGAMQTGAVNIDNKIYNFDESGKNIDAEKPAVNKTFNKDASESIKDNTQSKPSEDKNQSNNDSSSNTSNSLSSSSSKKSKKIKIDKVETVRNGVLKVYLNKATSVALTKDSFAISCPGLGEMTIFSVENATGSDANRVYTLKIAYYDDNIYTVHIDLPNGTSIEKQFESRYDCPEISTPIMKRINDTTAEFYYVSDAEGTFYYMLEEQENARSRNYSRASTPTEDQIIASGKSSKMNIHENTIPIGDLKENTSYIMYYVAKDVDGKVTLVKSEVIDLPSINDNEFNSINITNITANVDNKADFNDYRYWFTFELSEATASKLTLDNFKITCPSDGDLTLGKIETEDNKTYNVYMEKGYIPKDNNTFTGKITFDNGTSTEYRFYVDLTAPNISSTQIARTSQAAVELTFKSSEGGTLYYSILDKVNQDTSAKDPTAIYEKGKKKTISYGTNIIKIEDDSIATGKWLCFATEDKYGNRAMYYDYIKIPEYKAPSEDNGTTEEKLAITDVQAGVDGYGKHYIDVTFNKEIDSYNIDKNLIQITNMDKRPRFDSDVQISDKITLKIGNGVTIGPGEHTLILYYYYNKTDFDKLTYTFTVK